MDGVSVRWTSGFERWAGVVTVRGFGFRMFGGLCWVRQWLGVLIFLGMD